MNKAFVREPDRIAEYCPRCGSKGEPVAAETLQSFLSEDQRRMVAEPANFCPSPQCDVVYFDSLDRTVRTADIQRPVYPKNPAAPLCPCFGLTREDIEQDVHEGVATRTRAVLEKAKSRAAQCRKMTANGRPCVAYVQKYYLQCLQGKK